MASNAIRYVGDGTESYFGIPARDLTPDDFAALSDEQRALVEASRLYDAAALAPVSAPAPTFAPAPVSDPAPLPAEDAATP